MARAIRPGAPLVASTKMASDSKMAFAAAAGETVSTTVPSTMKRTRAPWPCRGMTSSMNGTDRSLSKGKSSAANGTALPVTRTLGN